MGANLRCAVRIYLAWKEDREPSGQILAALQDHGWTPHRLTTGALKWTPPEGGMWEETEQAMLTAMRKAVRAEETEEIRQ